VTLADAAADVAAGVALLVAGAAVWTRVRSTLVGPLLVLAGVAWLAGDVTGALAYAHRGPLVHAVLTFPSGRTRSRTTVVVIALAYVDGFVPTLARAPWPTLVLVGAIVGTALRRWASARGVQRRTLLVSLVSSVVMATPLTVAAIGRLAGSDLYGTAGRMFQTAVVLVAGALALDLLSGRSVRAATTGLILDIAGRSEPRALRDALSRTVGDPTLEIAFRVDQGWVDEAGEPARLPGRQEMADRLVTMVEDEGAPVAALVHDPSALRDSTLAQSVGAAVRLVLANVRLQAQETARMRDVAASRRRLVETGDEERRRLGEQLRDGAERILATVSAELVATAASRRGESAAAVGLLIRELDGARQDLDLFAHGVHPPALTEHGLAAALRDLADHAAVPVTLSVPPQRFPAAQEAAVFFVCSEALANVAKYADASFARIEVSTEGARLLVLVVDDGRGGADPSRGSGLRGLRDRVEAFGGRLRIHSPAREGTRLEAELPIGSGLP
jgi:signal transduction histidine kinase